MNVVEYSKDIQVILEKYTGIVVNAIRELMEMNLMTKKRLELPNGILIILDKKLESTQMKEKGFINGIGKKIVTECHVGEEVFSRLIKEYGDLE